ncbi:MAG: bifunctional 3-hydroxydecanoyl-ACP dehydratase/trans-2-decenoyl-ACP isomerase [Alphaproteobacteria bacterium]|nr:bifunctional 3-hydroxydecanoyl-ACP dehydratase/trans-2-decenoyl-ACP isomerase [Alphaproteobacteria bacterium]
MTVKEYTKKSSYNYEELIICGNGDMFGHKYGKLPSPPMLMFDKITDVSETGGTYGNGYMRAEMTVKPDLWFFDCHFQHDPVMPGCLGLDAMWQLIGFFLLWSGNAGKGRALGAGKVRFSDQVLRENKKINYEIEMKRVIKSRSLTVGIGDARLLIDGKPSYSAEDLKVGLFVDKEA